MEKDITKEATHSERKHDICAVVAGFLVSHETATETVDHEYGYNRDEESGKNSLTHEWERAHDAIKEVKDLLSVRNLNDPLE